MRRLTFTTIFLISPISLVIGLSRGLSQQNAPPNARLFATGNCAQPCWHGIQPGKTTLNEAEAILRADMASVTAVGRQNPVIRCSIYWTMPSKPEFSGCAYSQDGNVIT